MAYLVLILSIFSLLLIFFNYKNQHTWYFLLINTSLFIFIFSFLLLVSKFGSYINSGYVFFELDYTLFLYISKLKISYYDIVRLINLGISTYIFSLVLFSFRYRNAFNSRFAKTLPGKIKYLLILLFPFWYFFYYNPTVGYWLHILFYSDSSKSMLLTNIIFYSAKIIDFLNNAILYLYLIIPTVNLYNFASKFRIKKLKIQHFTISFFILCINLVFVCIILSEPMRTMNNYTQFDNALSLNASFTTMAAQIYKNLCLFCLIFSQITFWLLIKHSSYNILPFYTKAQFRKSKQELANNSREILHSFKNTIFSVQILCKQAELLTEPQDIKNLFSRINNVCETSLESITSTLNSFGEIAVSYQRCSISEVLDKIITMANIPSEITVKKDYTFNDTAVISPYHLEQAMINIVTNAIESIVEKKEKEGKIEISTFLEDKWIAICIKDNGIGIKRCNYKKIFKPFSSEKHLSTNWGLGLYYAKRIVEAHQGHIFVESKHKVYTTFQILLPL